MQDYNTRIREIQEKRNDLDLRSNRILNSFGLIASESERVANVAKNAKPAICNLESEFESQTGLSKLDMVFLFLATALQCVRQYLLTGFPERLDDQKAANLTRGHFQEHSNRLHRWYNPTLEEIITNPVPFDAMYGSPDFALGLSGRTHRRLTLGHDPILGWIFGTANIATSTITTRNFSSYHVKTGKIIRRDQITNYAQTPHVLYYTKEKLFNNGLEGKKIIGTSLIKEYIHLKSDINTKESLPFPVISTISPEIERNLASYGIDMANIVNVGKQAGFSILINTLISMIHYLFFDSDRDVSRRLYEVRTRKILTYSNLIASSSNLLYVAISASLGNVASIKKIDIGGFLVTIYRLITDTQFIQDVKEEFVFNNFHSMIRGECA